MMLPLVLAIAPAALGATAEDPRVVAAAAALPAELVGLTRDRTPRNDGLIIYRNGPLDPVLAISISSLDRPLNDEMARGSVVVILGAPDSTQKRREGPFAAGAGRESRGYFGEQVSEKGTLQVWVRQYDGVFTVVKAMIPRVDDRRRIYDSVMRELFGGASLIQAN